MKYCAHLCFVLNHSIPIEYIVVGWTPLKLNSCDRFISHPVVNKLTAVYQLDTYFSDTKLVSLSLP